MANKKLEPREGIRAIDYLCLLFPDKTGTELLAIHEHDKKCHELYMQKGQEEVRAFAKRINDAGAIYYKGRFGLDQRFFYKVSNAKVYDDGTLVGSVDSLTCFLGEDRDVFEGRINIELKTDKFERLDNYGFDMCTETTEEEYNEALGYLRGVSKFWEKFDEDKF
jgi:hypothetical protein